MDEIDPLVHTIETSQHESPSVSYRDHVSQFHTAELSSAQEAYQAIDLEDGSSFLERMNKCRTHAYFHRHEDTGEVRVISSCCRVRWCPFCSEARKYRVQDVVKSWLPDVQRAKFLTLTLKHDDVPLSDQISRLYKCFVKLRRLAYFRKNISGGIWFFQVKQSEDDGLWHPHLHCMIDALYMPRKYISEQWLKITTDSMVIDIRMVKDEDTIVDYIARYAAKPAMLKDMDIETRIELIRALHGRRLIGTWGSAKELSFRTAKQEDANKWAKLAPFYVVKSRFFQDDNCKAIFNAWRKSEPLPEAIVPKHYEPDIDDHYIKKRYKSADCHGQLWLAYYY